MSTPSAATFGQPEQETSPVTASVVRPYDFLVIGSFGSTVLVHWYLGAAVLAAIALLVYLNHYRDSVKGGVQPSDSPVP